MKNSVLREQLLKCKPLLYSIFTREHEKDYYATLEAAQVYTINTILHYLHKLCNGHVKLKNADFQEVKRRKKLRVLRKGIELRSSLRTAIKNKEIGLNFLKKLAPVIHIIFKPLFEK